MPPPKYLSIARRRDARAVERLFALGATGRFRPLWSGGVVWRTANIGRAAASKERPQNQDSPETNRKQSPGREESDEGITGQPKPGREGNEEGSGRQAPGSGQTPGEDDDEKENDRGKQAGGSQGGGKQAPGREQGGNEQTGGSQPGGQKDRSHGAGGSKGQSVDSLADRPPVAPGAFLSAAIPLEKAAGNESQGPRRNPRWLTSATQADLPFLRLAPDSLVSTRDGSARMLLKRAGRREKRVGLSSIRGGNKWLNALQSYVRKHDRKRKAPFHA